MVFIDQLEPSADRQWDIPKLPHTRVEQLTFGLRIMENIYLDRLAGLPDPVILPKIAAAVSQVKVEGGFTPQEMFRDILDKYAQSQALVLIAKEINVDLMTTMQFPNIKLGSDTVFAKHFSAIRAKFASELDIQVKEQKITDPAANSIVVSYLVSRSFPPSGQHASGAASK